MSTPVAPDTGMPPIDDPLDFIRQDHQQERDICALLEQIAQQDLPRRDDVKECLAFLRHRLPHHLQDEEQGLFPILLRRCPTADEMEKIIGVLQRDHDHAGHDTPDVIMMLDCLEADNTSLTDDDRRDLVKFATNAKRHLILENAIVLPFARLRLTDEDLAELRDGMLARRAKNASK